MKAKKETIRKILKYLFYIISGIGIIIGAVTGILDYAHQNKVDFNLYYTVSTNGKKGTYTLKKSSDESKNFYATMYYIIEFPINGENVYYIYSSTSKTLNLENGSEAFCFEYPIDYNESAFCEAYSILYYLYSDKNLYPVITIYVDVSYTTKLFDIDKHKWYKISGGDIYNCTIPGIIKQTIDENKYPQENIVAFYSIADPNVDKEYINENIDIKYTFDEIADLVDDRENREQTPDEKKALKADFYNYSNAIQMSMKGQVVNKLVLFLSIFFY